MVKLSPTEYLDSRGVEYTLLPHSPSFTAQHTAQASHIRGHELSKVIVIGEGKTYMMAVIPANCILVKNELTRLLRAPNLKIVPEYEFRDLFPGCEVGAMPPFGELYNMKVLAAKELTDQEMMTFNGGTHSVLIQMKTEDFVELGDIHSMSVGYRVAGLSHPIISKRKDDWLWL
jgi:Ala-tRNA(Pro) deacylase